MKVIIIREYIPKTRKNCKDHRCNGCIRTGQRMVDDIRRDTSINRSDKAAIRKQLLSEFEHIRSAYLDDLNALRDKYANNLVSIMNKIKELSK